MVNEGGGGDEEEEEEEFRRSARVDIVREFFRTSAPSERKSPNSGVRVSETLIRAKSYIRYSICNKSFTYQRNKITKRRASFVCGLKFVWQILRAHTPDSSRASH